MIRNCHIRLSVFLSGRCCRFRNVKSTICSADYDRNLFPCTNLIGIHGCPEQIPAGCIFRTSYIGPCPGSQQTAAALLPYFLINFRQHIRFRTLGIDFKISVILFYQLSQYIGFIECSMQIIVVGKRDRCIISTCSAPYYLHSETRNV